MTNLMLNSSICRAKLQKPVNLQKTFKNSKNLKVTAINLTCWFIPKISGFRTLVCRNQK